jgi:hypothetical protein
MYVLNAMMATDLPDIVFYTHKGRFKIRSGLFLISSFQLLDTILVPLFGRLSLFSTALFLTCCRLNWTPITARCIVDLPSSPTTRDCRWMNIYY